MAAYPASAKVSTATVLVGDLALSWSVGDLALSWLVGDLVLVGPWRPVVAGTTEVATEATAVVAAVVAPTQARAPAWVVPPRTRTWER